MTLSAQEMIRRLDLQRHPEGGWYRQTWAGPEVDGRPNGTCIYFLRRSGLLPPGLRYDFLPDGLRSDLPPGPC
mgnify:CR=1 FL=1